MPPDEEAINKVASRLPDLKEGFPWPSVEKSYNESYFSKL